MAQAFLAPLFAGLGATSIAGATAASTAAGFGLFNAAGAIALPAAASTAAVTGGVNALAGGALLGGLGALGQIATVAQPVLGVASAISANQTARAQQAEFEREGRERRVAAALEAEKLRRSARLANSREAGLALEAGALSGTTIDVLNQNSVAAELDALTVEYNGEQGGLASDFQAGQARAGRGALPVLSAAMRGYAQIDPLNLTPGGGAGSYYG